MQEFGAWTARMDIKTAKACRIAGFSIIRLQIIEKDVFLQVLVVVDVITPI
jgi:hypothetical protein